MMRRVVVTGMSALTSLGNAFETWERILANQSAVNPLPKSWDTLGAFRTKQIAAISREIDGSSKTVRFTDLASYCAEEAIRDSNFCPSDIDEYRFGVILGSGMGGLTMIENQAIEQFQFGNKRIHPFGVPMTMPNALSGHLAVQYQAKGPNLTISTACSSANHAIGLAYESIRSGKADVMITGGSESLITPIVFSAFDKLRVMSPGNEICRPFAKNRKGFVLGEGSAILILEEMEYAESRGAPIYAEIVGYSALADAFNMVMPDPTGEGVSRTIKQALGQTGLSFEDIDYINAHGTGTVAGDEAEANGIRKVFGPLAADIPISSIKGAVGHTLGASAAIEAVISILAMNKQVIPPTVGCELVDETLGLQVVTQPKPKSIRTILSNSFGFGGNNSALVIKSF